MTDATNLTIQPISDDEAEALLAFAKKTFIDAFAQFNSRSNMEIYLAEKFTLAKIKSELATPGSSFFFARVHNEVAGYLKVNVESAQTESIDGRAMEIERIYVAHDYQGKGVAQALFDKALCLAKEYRADSVWLGVWEENPRAIRFYEKCGFEVFDTHSFRLGEELQTDIMMRLSLN